VEKRAKVGLEKIAGFEAWRISASEKLYTEAFKGQKIVYLTAESPNVLEEFDPGSVYVIGGMVDHNRLKGQCHSSAEAAGVETARLPIEGNVDLRGTRTVLTVNHVFELLLRKHEVMRLHDLNPKPPDPEPRPLVPRPQTLDPRP
jgi:tRNA (guanine9-N1)-methyltransferase